jgi:hypothetical protein
VVAVTAVTVVGSPAATRKGVARSLEVLESFGSPILELDGLRQSACNVKGATAAVMRCGCQQGEFFEGYEMHGGKAGRTPDRP